MNSYYYNERDFMSWYFLNDHYKKNKGAEWKNVKSNQYRDGDLDLRPSDNSSQSATQNRVKK